MRKLTKQEKENVVKDIGKIITAISTSIKKDEEEFIDGMVALMKKQSAIMAVAKSKGLKIEKLMPRIKVAYENSKSATTRK